MSDFEKAFAAVAMAPASSYKGRKEEFMKILNAEGSDELRRLFREAVKEANSDAASGLNALFPMGA